MTPEEEALATAVRLLRQLEIPYMLTGSVATSYHGRPRATHDADLVIDPGRQQLEQLVSALASAGFYVDPDRAMDALERRSLFNVVEMRSACKLDLIVRQDRPFSREEFARRQQVELTFGQGVEMVTAEDSILSKLEWARRTGDSPRQLADAAGVVRVNPNLDREYIEHWALELGVIDLWRAISNSGST